MSNRRFEISTLIACFCLLFVLSGCSPEKAVEATEAEQTANIKQSSSIEQSASVELTRLKQGWTSLGMSVEAGNTITFSTEGELNLGLAHPLQPKHGLWGRIGESGVIFQFASNHPTITAEESGKVYITVLPSGLLWANRNGDLLPAFEQVPNADISIAVRAILWNGDAVEGLTQLKESADANEVKLAQSALADIDEAKTLPAGFEYLWYLSSSNVYAAFSDGSRSGVHAHTVDDFGIIRKPVDLPLTPDTRVSFEWLYQSVPALGPETDAAKHDYLSVAVEFDNGRDITWMWSKELAPGTRFECPLPEWQGREWHVVQQTGEDDLGNWFSHDLNIVDEYEKTIPGELPSRVTAVWIITNSVFDRQKAEAYFANIVLHDGDSQVEVF